MFFTSEAGLQDPHAAYADPDTAFFKTDLGPDSKTQNAAVCKHYLKLQYSWFVYDLYPFFSHEWNMKKLIILFEDV